MALMYIAKSVSATKGSINLGEFLGKLSSSSLSMNFTGEIRDVKQRLPMGNAVLAHGNGCSIVYRF